MTVNMISIRCPECGADLDFEEGRKQMFCSYCGSKIMIDKDNEFDYRYTDVAAVKRANTDEIVKLKKIEIGKRVADFKLKMAIVLSIVGVIVTIIGFLLGTMSGDEQSLWFFLGFLGLLVCVAAVLLWISFFKSLDEAVDYGDKIKIPDLANYQQKSYLAMQAMFEEAGFTNITCVPLHDLKLGLLKREGSIDSIMINGESAPLTRKRYSPDVSVIINYHSH